LSLRVLILCDGSSGWRPDAPAWFAHDLFATLAGEAGVEPMLVACVEREGDRQLPGAGSDARTAGPGAGPGAVPGAVPLAAGTFDAAMLCQRGGAHSLRALVDLLREFRPDVVHVDALRPLGVDALVAIRRTLPAQPIVLALRDGLAMCANGGTLVRTAGDLCGGPSAEACGRCLPGAAPNRFAVREAHVRTMLAIVDRFVVPSRALRERLVAWGLPRARFRVVASALPERAPPSLNDRTRRTFGMFGDLSANGGLDLALQAVRHLARIGLDVRLHLHGETKKGACERDRDVAAALSHREAGAEDVVWHGGPYARDELPARMAAVDWVLVPTRERAYGGIRVLEAWQAGRPVIVSDVDGLAETVRNEPGGAGGAGGLLFRRGDAADLARAMRRAAEEEGLWQRLAATVPPVPTMENAADRHLALYGALLCAARSGEAARERMHAPPHSQAGARSRA
jgi:glycosyltransferase involved in cell wall biosynthesis